MDQLPRFSVAAIVFTVTLAFGLWLSRKGKPYHSLLFNIHKLAALAAVILSVIQVIKAPKGSLSMALLILLVVVAALCVGGLFISGAFMSLNRPGYGNLRTIHKIGSLGATLVIALAVFLVGI